VIPSQLPIFTVTELERKAATFLQDAFPRGIQIPIDVELLLETRDGVDFDLWPKLKVNHDVAGAVMKDVNRDRLVIYVDEDIADNDSCKNFYRMTVAEELAHIVLHESVIKEVCAIDDFYRLQKHKQWYEAERNAKRFAAAMLMPSEALLRESKRIYCELVRTAGYGNVEVVKKYLCNHVAKLFEVSPQAMSIRLREWPMRVYERVEEAMGARLETLF
jgi:Zn-dependent peptidase ImmA (M78 family)